MTEYIRQSLSLSLSLPLHVYCLCTSDLRLAFFYLPLLQTLFINKLTRLAAAAASAVRARSNGRNGRF
jgi:hypothetical protein